MLNTNVTALNEKNQNLNEPIVLWGLSLSPYVRKVMIALAEKNLNFIQKEILPKSLLQATNQHVPSEFEQINPCGKIPAIQIGAVNLADSTVIMAYLDKKFATGHSLYPQNPEAFAQTLWFERYAEQTLHEIIYKKIFVECIVKPKVLNIQMDDALVQTTVTKELPIVLQYLDQCVQTHQWLACDDFTAADIAIITQLLALQLCGVPFNQWKNLQNYFAKVISRPSVQSLMR